MAGPEIITAAVEAVEVRVLSVQLQLPQLTEKAVQVVQDYRQVLTERQQHAQVAAARVDTRLA
jgi:hypothetical protein